jgi:drug/metabolite transporter (DMT)-like permease
MSTQHATRIKLAPWALLLVAASWGWAFVIMKESIARQSVNNFLFSRFALAVIVMILIRPQVFRFFDKDLVTRSAFAGTFLGAGYILQTLGLERTGAAITGFITGLYVVFTPVIAAFVLKTRITLLTWGCVALATIGLGLLSIRGWTVGVGELLILACAFCFGAHIISLGKWSSGRDAYAMTVVQLATCTAMTGLASVAEGGYSPPPDWGVWATVVFTAVVCTAAAFMVQTWSQAHMSTT